MQVTRKSMISGVVRTLELDVTIADLQRYETGMVLLQDAFPHLSASDREFIKTGITDKEWRDLFGDDSSN